MIVIRIIIVIILQNKIKILITIIINYRISDYNHFTIEPLISYFSYSVSDMVLLILYSRYGAPSMESLWYYCYIANVALSQMWC